MPDDQPPADTPVSAKGPQQRLVPKGIERRRKIDPVRVALIASAAWLVVIGAYAIGFFAGAAQPEVPQPRALSVLLFLLGGLGPVALMLLAASLLAQVEAIRQELARLTGTSSPALQGEGVQRYARQAAQQSAQTLARLEAIERLLGQIGPSTGQGTPSLAARRTTAPPPDEAETDQASLPLAEDDAAPAVRVPWADIIRALDFPRDADDQRGFDAVRSAIRDPQVAQLLQAAEDVLTILAADGLHMEDFAPEHASLGAWRSYGDGTRGKAVAAIGGITDEAALERTRDRLRADPIFRDAGLVFVRRWNGLVTRILAEMGEDPALRDAADSRSGRAFMLVARAMGVFG
jgi:hypothetical protein